MTVDQVVATLLLRPEPWSPSRRSWPPLVQTTTTPGT